MRVDDYVQKRKRMGRYRRLILRCPFHMKCEKKRSISLQNTKKCGPLEPIGYLMVWRDLHVPGDDRPHNKLPVPAAMVQEWVANNPFFDTDIGLPY